VFVLPWYVTFNTIFYSTLKPFGKILQSTYNGKKKTKT
jgi:hypothetical protein